jgi:hypothetical protein
MTRPAGTALAALPYRHVLQSWEWGQFKPLGLDAALFS